jgi:hypothetical protein
LIDNEISYNSRDFKQTLTRTDEGLDYYAEDADGEVLLNAGTSYSQEENRITTALIGTFYGREGAVRAKMTRYQLDAADGVSFEMPAMGGGFRLGPVLSLRQHQFVEMLAITRGAINRIVTGDYANQDLDLDGAMLINFHAENCNVFLKTIMWAPPDEPTKFVSCEFFFEHPVKFIDALVQSVQHR